jgi:hypothetical protein
MIKMEHDVIKIFLGSVPRERYVIKNKFLNRRDQIRSPLSFYLAFV